MGTLILVTGTGRSGTSTLAGMLHHLDLHVPGPHFEANDSNPKGFFESRWAVSFHKRLLQAAGLHDFDGRPTAFALVQERITPSVRDELVGFLREQSAGHEQTVVKDPRSVWVQALWADAAAQVGLDTRFVSMLRHPAEVVGSRAAYYARSAGADRLRHYQVFNVARWVNNALLNERETRGHPRAFVLYDGLLADWRAEAALLSSTLDLGLDVPAADEPHPVDDFIDVDLRRVRVGWDELDVPAELVSIAQDTWQALLRLRECGGSDVDSERQVDALSERYSRLFNDSASIAHDAVEEARASARSRPSTEARTGAGRPVGDVGGRELLRIALQRARGRLLRRSPASPRRQS